MKYKYTVKLYSVTFSCQKTVAKYKIPLNHKTLDKT